MNEQKKIEIFEEAFRSGVGHSEFTYCCGKVFYNSNGGWDWEDGELEELEKSGATDLAKKRNFYPALSSCKLNSIFFNRTGVHIKSNCRKSMRLRFFGIKLSFSFRPNRFKDLSCFTASRTNKLRR